MDSPGDLDPYEQQCARPTSCLDLFLTFSKLALQGFGGVLAIAQQVLCDQKRWLTRAEFVELLSIGQVLPGPNVCNVSLMVGDRFFGWRGAFSALAGMMLIPLVVVLALTALYEQFSALPAVSGALRGMGAVAAGLIIGTALKLAQALARNPIGLGFCLAFGGATFAMVALARWPLVWILLGLGLSACTLAWLRISALDRRSDARE
jgi:chromate transporter